MQRVHDGKLAWAIMSATFLMDALILYRGQPQNVDSTITGVILGVWHALAGVVGSFYYGSSSDSTRKTELLAAATPAARDPNVADKADKV